jgi:hypothetical protein
MLYGLALALPALALIGAGAGRRGRKKWLGLFLLMTLAGSILFLPACGQNNVMLNNPNSLITPKNTYTFTLTGVDANGEGPSNAVSTSAQASVALTVN